MGDHEFPFTSRGVTIAATYIFTNHINQYDWLINLCLFNAIKTQTWYM